MTKSRGIRIMNDLPRRYESKIDRSAGPDGCHPWLAGTESRGYGKIKVAGRMRTATHVGWEIEHGQPFPWPCVLHRCDNPPCMNPRHWFFGDRADNNEDKTQKGRQYRPAGELNARARVTEEQVREIRRRYVKKYGALRALAKEMDLPETLISDIVRGRAWKDVKMST